MKTFKVEKDTKLNKFLEEKYGAELPYSSYKKLLRNKDIKVNGKRINSEISLKVGDILDVYFDGVKKSLNILFKDDNILVLDKPCGVTSEDFELQVKKEFSNAKLTHRLDRNTSGIIIFSLNESAYEELLKAFKDRTIDKYYLAEIYGSFNEQKGVLSDYLIKDSENSLVKVVKDNLQGSVKIITEYSLVESFKETSILSVKLITGKTHQIREHFAFYGHFIKGDGKYGDNNINKRLKAKYHHLTAEKVVFNFDSGTLKYLDKIEIKLNRKPW